jgi:hypothetical protein
MGINMKAVQMTLIPWRLGTVGALTIALGVAMARVVTSQVAAPSVTMTGQPQSARDPFTTLNDASRITYRLAKNAALARAGTVILVEGDDLVLKRGSQRTQVRFIPEIFHLLKAVSHVTLAIDVTLAAHTDENPLSDHTLKDLRDYCALLPPVLDKLDSSGLDGEQRVRARTILEQSMAFLTTVIERRGCTQSDRIAFARRMWPLITMNGESAARAALDSLHHQVSLWKRELREEEWKNVVIVVMGSQLPRRGNLAVQYFARLLGQSGEGRRIIYAESLFEEPRALDLLATHLVDSRIGVEFFNDPERMKRDLLSDAAQQYLPILLDEP